MSPEKKHYINQIADPNAEQARRVRQLTTPSWEVVSGMLEKRTHNKARLHDLFVNNLGELKIYYEVVYDAVVNGNPPIRPDVSDNHNKIFSTHYRIIRESVTRVPEQRHERRPKSVRTHTRRMMEQLRHTLDPDFEQAVIPLLRQKIPDFDKTYARHLGLLDEIFKARREIYETGKTDLLSAISDEYSSPGGQKFDPKHPDILMEVKPATLVIVGIYNRKQPK